MYMYKNVQKLFFANSVQCFGKGEFLRIEIRKLDIAKQVLIKSSSIEG